MAVSNETRSEVQDRISRLLEQYGKDYNFTLLLAEYPDVAKPTFYRWVNKIHSSGVPGQNAIRKARKRVKHKTKKEDIKTVHQQAALAVVEQLPTPPTVHETHGMSLDQVAVELNRCIDNANKVVEYAKREDGQVRNAKLLLTASEHLRRTIETSARLMEMLWDIKRTEQFHQAIFRRLKERDPAFVELILNDLKQLNIDWGIDV